MLQSLTEQQLVQGFRAQTSLLFMCLCLPITPYRWIRLCSTQALSSQERRPLQTLPPQRSTTFLTVIKTFTSRCIKSSSGGCAQFFFVQSASVPTCNLRLLRRVQIQRWIRLWSCEVYAWIVHIRKQHHPQAPITVACHKFWSQI